MTKFLFSKNFYFQNQPVFISKKLIFVDPNELVPNQAEFENKLKEKINQEESKLADKIAKLEKEHKSQPEIKDELQKEKESIFRKALEQAIKELRLKVTYDQLSTDQNTAPKFQELQNKYFAQIEKQLDQHVDKYFQDKQRNIQKTVKSLRDLPPATQKEDLESPNPDTQRLIRERLERDKALAEQRGERGDFLNDDSTRYLKHLSEIDNYTSPDSTYDHGIKDFDDGYFGKSTDKDNPVRYRLNGYLYANFHFFGGGETGISAVKNRVEEAYELYHSTLGDSRFTAVDLNQKMGMEYYFDQVKQYSDSDRVIGFMAGLVKLMNDNVKNNPEYTKYKDYLNENFERIKGKPESEQLKELFALKTFANYLNVGPEWRGELKRIDGLTDPNQSGNRIDDYPGTKLYIPLIFSDRNKNNSTRAQLNGYLYSVYLFNNKNTIAVDKEFEKAYMMFKDNGAFEQEHLENLFFENNPEKKGFGLEKYLAEAKNNFHIKNNQTLGVVAGMLKFATETLKGDEQSTYLAYLRAIFAKATNFDSEDTQLMFLSSIKAPSELGKDVNEQLRNSLLDFMIEATKQHTQFRFTNNDVQKFQDRKTKTLDLNQHNDVAAKARKDIEDFIMSRTDRHMNEQIDGKDNPDGLLFKYALLVENNGKLPQPVLTKEDLDQLRLTIDELNKEFGTARQIASTNRFDTAVNEKYLSKLSTAEKKYYDLANELDNKLKTVTESAKKPDQPTLPEGGAPTGPGVVPPPHPEVGGEEKEAIEKAWENGKEVVPDMKDYTGTLVVNVNRVDARNDNGKIVNSFPRGMELFRTADDASVRGWEVNGVIYVRVSEGKDTYWLPEKSLTMKEEPVSPPIEGGTSTEQVPQQPGVYLPDNLSIIKSNAEINPAGYNFDLPFNEGIMKCKLQKQADGAHLTYNYNNITGEQIFPSLDAAMDHLDHGYLNQRVTLELLANPKSWEPLAKRMDKRAEIKKTGQNTLMVELDWDRNHDFQTGNVKCYLTVLSDGMIDFRMEKDNIGPNGENVRMGNAGNFKGLTETLLGLRDWSENYYQIVKSEKALEPHRAALMDVRTYSSHINTIGHIYGFRNWYRNSFCTMNLEWQNVNNVRQRNLSVINPTLDVKLNNDGTITYRLTNHTGPNLSRMGIFGTVQNFDTLITTIDSIRRNPQLMNVPLENIPVLKDYNTFLN